MKSIVVLGGGTGTFTVLTGLKRHPVRLTAIVSSADSGGSSGTLRDELGVLPPGDVRQCLVALAESDDLRKIFNYRFEEGSLTGHTVGNILISALECMEGDSLEAIRIAQRILNVRGQVIPVSGAASHLAVKLKDGTTIHGEHQIDIAAKRASIVHCFLSSPTIVNPEALEAILAADVIVIGPGDLYTSLVPVLLVEGVNAAIARSRAKRLYISNLTYKPGHTDGFTATRFYQEIVRYLAPGTLSGVIMNSAIPEAHLITKYESAGESLVKDDLVAPEVQIQRWPLLAEGTTVPHAGDRVKRSFLRHDPEKLAFAILACAEAIP